MKEKLKIIPLGGLNEIGKNMTVIEYGNDIVVIDCGVAFPDDDMLGVDLVIPDTTYLKRNLNKLRGYVIELTDQAEYDVRKIKEITEICKDSVAIESQLIALAFWMKKNYGGTMNQALKTVIPIKQKTAAKEKRILVLAVDEKTAEEQLAEFRRKHNVARARLLEALIRERELSGDVVKEELNVGLNVVRAMEKLGILKIRTTGIRCGSGSGRKESSF